MRIGWRTDLLLLALAFLALACGLAICGAGALR